MKKFSNIVPIGFFCGVAQELERIGLRNCAYPIDWLITELEPLIDCISCNFMDFLNLKYLEKDLTEKEQKYTYVVQNTKYHIKFFHDFQKGISIEDQLQDVTEKYDRRIQRFYKNISEQPTLFIRYIKNEAEWKYIEEHYQEILNWLKSYHPNHEIIYIINDDVCVTNAALPITIFLVKKDKNDSVSRKCFLQNKRIVKYIYANVEFSLMKRLLQVVKYKKKVFSTKKTNFIDKIKKKIKKRTKK